MKTTLSKAVGYSVALQEIAMNRLPVKAGYAVMKNMKTLGEEAERFDKLRMGICEKYARKDDNGTPQKRRGIRNGKAFEEYDIPEDKMGELTAEINDLTALETDIDIHKISFDDIAAVDQADRYDPLTPAQLMTIDFMIEG